MWWPFCYFFIGHDAMKWTLKRTQHIRLSVYLFASFVSLFHFETYFVSKCINITLKKTMNKVSLIENNAFYTLKGLWFIRSKGKPEKKLI